MSIDVWVLKLLIHPYLAMIAMIIGDLALIKYVLMISLNVCRTFQLCCRCLRSVVSFMAIWSRYLILAYHLSILLQVPLILVRYVLAWMGVLLISLLDSMTRLINAVSLFDKSDLLPFCNIRCFIWWLQESLLTIMLQLLLSTILTLLSLTLISDNHTLSIVIIGVLYIFYYDV